MKKVIAVLLVALATSCADRKIQATVQGQTGSSCSTHQMEGSAIISCTDGTSSMLYHGQSGLNGTNGADGTDGVVEVINPCGEEFANDEVFLRLSSGRILALYDGGANLDRLVLLAPGNYITTDAVQNKSCSFTVTPQYQIINEVRR